MSWQSSGEEGRQSLQRNIQWHESPKSLALSGDEVHVWRTSVTRTATEIQTLLQFLSPDEIARAERFHFRKGRENYIVTRGTLRLLLGRYLNVSPADLRFCYNAHGKPSLAGAEAAAKLRFNLSHSHELVLYAMTIGREVGLDVEYMRQALAGVEIAQRFFSPAEIDALKTLPAPMQMIGFYNCWTRKEAYLKARGEGLSYPLSGFNVSLKPGEPAALLDVIGHPREVFRWSLQDLKPGLDYAAALAVEGPGWRLRCLDCSIEKSDLR